MLTPRRDRIVNRDALQALWAYDPKVRDESRNNANDINQKLEKT